MRHTLTLAAIAALTASASLAQAQEHKSHDSGRVGKAEAAPASPALQGWQTGIQRTDLLRRDLQAAGHETIQARVDFEPGVASPKHSHPGEEVAFVLEGTLEYRLEGRPPVTLKTGEALFIPAGTPHIAINIGTTKASELATYIVRKGFPLVVAEK